MRNFRHTSRQTILVLSPTRYFEEVEKIDQPLLFLPKAKNPETMRAPIARLSVREVVVGGDGSSPGAVMIVGCRETAFETPTNIPP